ncbi:MAG: DUF2207 domain-containing protein, partial [Bacilli bacterium]|nr:DUF2207 domain-containing protein [Bacilli bacterium]
MKKIIWGILIFLASPVLAWAADYNIDNYAVRAYIQNNGDVKIQEILVLDGSFNGYERDLDFKPHLTDNSGNATIYQGSDITDIEIRGKYINKFQDSLFNDADYTLFSKTSYASNGDIGKVVMSTLSGGYRLRMYYRANNQKVAFYITYTIKDAVVLHNDVAEFYWPFIGDTFEDDFKNVDIKVYLPNDDNTDYFRVWGHGSLYGEIKMLDKKGASIYLDKYDAGEVLDVRITFDKSLITDTTRVKKSNEDFFEEILTIEAKRGEEADKLREKLLAKYNFVKYSTIVIYGLMIILGVYIYIKYGKSPKSGYYSKYNREFIDDYNVEVIDYLMNKKITPNAMSASIMNLIYKKNISAEEIPGKKTKKMDFTFTLLNSDNLN